MKISDYITEFFVRKGVCDFFGYQGTMIAHLVDSIERHPLARNHSSYNEQGAAFAACGYAQAKGSCAAAYATSGPGATNLLTGVVNAFCDSLPVIFLTGQLNTYEYTGIEGLRQQGFQEIDIVSMARPVTKYAVQVRRREDIAAELNKAWHIANSGRKGPVLLDLPMNIQREELEDPVYDMPFEKEETSDRPEAAAVVIREALSKARRPVFLLGHGVDDAECRDLLLKYARKHSIPVVTSVLSKSYVAYDSEIGFGCLGSAYGHRYANMIVNAKSDLLVSFGMSMIPRQTGVKVHEFAKNARIIRMDVDALNLKREIHEGQVKEDLFHVDVLDVIRLLVQEEDENENCFASWLEVCTEIRRILEKVDEQIPERYVNRVIAELSDALTDAAAVSVDVGQHMVWSYNSFKNREGQSLLFSGGLGTMGYALPAAIGAYYAVGRPVACICGDGALQMNIQELQWVRRENIPIRILVMNNNALGLIRQQQKDYFNEVYAGAAREGGFTSCSFRAVAEAYGIESRSLNAEKTIEKAGILLKTDGPMLLEIRLEDGTCAFPKTCLGEPIHNPRPYCPKDVYERLMAL